MLSDAAANSNVHTRRRNVLGFQGRGWPDYDPLRVQLDDHFSRPFKEFVALCLKKDPAEVRAELTNYFDSCLTCQLDSKGGVTFVSTVTVLRQPTWRTRCDGLCPMPCSGLLPRSC